VEQKKTTKQLKRYKGLTNLELRVKEQIIEKVKANIDTFEMELKSLKTVIQVPRLRAALKDYDF